jgi:hypothetical protein
MFFKSVFNVSFFAVTTQLEVQSLDEYLMADEASRKIPMRIRSSFAILSLLGLALTSCHDGPAAGTPILETVYVPLLSRKGAEGLVYLVARMDSHPTD